LSRFARHILSGREIKAQQGRHRPGTDRHGLLHRLAAQAQQARRLSHVERPS
jgi:hypothetical protein